jgi:hypothetical protein
MNLLHKISILVSMATAAFAGEFTYGPSSAELFEIKGKVQSIFVRAPDVFFVKVRDTDGATILAWVKGNSSAMATLLAEKSSGGTVGIIYTKMAPNHDNNVNCHDLPYVTWVCNRVNWIETVE